MSNDKPGMTTEKATGERTRVAYPAREIEERWQAYWSEQGTFRTNPDPKRKFYVLVMFFYSNTQLYQVFSLNNVTALPAAIAAFGGTPQSTPVSTAFAAALAARSLLA